MHFPAHGHLFLPDDGDIVFGLTRNQTGVAPHAGVEINGHPPLVDLVADQVILLVLVTFPRSGTTPFVERYIFRGMRIHRTLLPHLGDLVLEGNLVAVVLHVIRRNFPGKSSTVHCVVLLDQSDWITPLSFGDRYRLDAEGGISPQLVGIKPRVNPHRTHRGQRVFLSNLPDTIASIRCALSVTQSNGDAVICMAKGHQDRNLHSS